MAILFYDHLISKIEIIELIDSLREEENQKGKALQLIDDIIYQSVVAHILEKLPSHHHEIFLSRLHETPYDPEILTYLKNHLGPDIEDQIRDAGKKVVNKIIKDLKDK